MYVIDPERVKMEKKSLEFGKKLSKNCGSRLDFFFLESLSVGRIK